MPPAIPDLRKAIDEAASVAGTLWLSYIFVLFYLLLAIAGVTHADQFLENNVKLPFLQIDLPMLGFFWIGPVIVLLVHAYVLHHLTLLASKARAFNALPETETDPECALLGVNLFAQMLAGPNDGRDRPAWWVEQVIAWVTLVLAPVLTLLYFELQFLPSHNESTTWWARLCLLGDLALLWWFWPRASCRSQPAWRDAELKPWGLGLMAVLSAATAYAAILVATFPGEWIADALPNVPFRERLVSGSRDGDTRVIRPIWPNRLFVAGIDVVDHVKYDTPAKLALATTTKSMRNRHLEGAIILEAQLDRADFTGAHLQGASLVRVHARGAWFDGADLAGAQLDDAQLQGASFFAARMPGATLDGTQLQGGRLAGANLRAAWLHEARLDGASLAGADLRRATLDKAWLLGANLNEARLHGASLVETKLEGASLDRAYTYRADFRHADAGLTGLRHIGDTDTPDEPCRGPPADACNPADTTETLHDLIRLAVPDSENRALMTARLLKPLSPDEIEPWDQESRAQLAGFKPLDDKTDKAPSGSASPASAGAPRSSSRC